MPRLVRLSDDQLGMAPDDPSTGPPQRLPEGTGPGHQMRLPGGGPWVMVTRRTHVDPTTHEHLRPGETWDEASNTIFTPVAAPDAAPIPPASPPAIPRPGEDWRPTPGDRRYHDGDILIEPGSLDSYLMDYADAYWNTPVRTVANMADTVINAINPINPVASIFSDIAEATGHMDHETAQQLRHLSPLSLTDEARKKGWIYDPHSGWGRLGRRSVTLCCRFRADRGQRR